MYAANDLAAHATFVRKFLIRCRESRLCLQRDKFVFAKSEITFAGIVLSDRTKKFKIKV